MTAVKNDSGKAQLSLVPQVALRALAGAMEVGQRKYSRYNYCKGMAASRLMDALLRHATAWNDGEDIDPSDGQHHLGSVMACCLMILRMEELGTLVDDRYKQEE